MRLKPSITRYRSGSFGIATTTIGSCCPDSASDASSFRCRSGHRTRRCSLHKSSWWYSRSIAPHSPRRSHHLCRRGLYQGQLTPTWPSSSICRDDLVGPGRTGNLMDSVQAGHGARAQAYALLHAPSSGAPAPEHAREPAGIPCSRTVAGASGACGGTFRSTRGGCSSMKKTFLVMTLAHLGAPLFHAFVLTALPVAAALSPSDLLAVRGLTVLVPRLPLPPLSRLVAAMFAAVAFQWMVRTEFPAASLQQTGAASRPASAASRTRTFSFMLIFETGWWMFTRAHGSLFLPEGSSLEGDLFPLRGTRKPGTPPQLPLEIRSDADDWRFTQNRGSVLPSPGVGYI
jgi:hypothetical protein